MKASVTAQAEAIANAFIDKPEKRKADYSRLSRDEVAAILNLHRTGKSQVEIAQILGCDHSTVSRWLDKLVDTTELAKHTLRNGAQALAERVIADADVEQSLEVLDRLDVVPKKRDESQRTGIQINIGMPNQPIGPDPLLSLVPRNEIGPVPTG